MLGRLVLFFQSKVGRVLRAVVSTALLVWVALRVEWSTLSSGKIEWAWVGAALVLSAGSYVVCAWRWWVLLRAQGVGMSFARAHAVVWVGQFYNAFLPGGVGGDAARLAAAFTDAPEQKAGAAVATLVDRIAGFGVLLVVLPIAWAAGALGGRVAWAGQMSGWVWALVAVGVIAGVFIILFWIRCRLPVAWREAAGKVWARPGSWWAAVGLSAVVWAMDFVAGWWLARAVGVEVGLGIVAVALGLAYLSTLLPISIGGHGLREGALVVALQNMGVSGRLTEFALLFFAVTVVCSLAGGLVALRKK